MEFLHQVLLFLHLIGMAVLVAAFLLQRRTGATGPLNSAWLHGAALQLITGLGLVGVAEAQDAELDNVKFSVKLLVLLVIGGLVLVFRKRDPLPSWLLPTLAGLVVLNVGVAVFWQ